MSTTRNLPADGPKRTAGRKKLTTDMGKQIQQRERRRMAREQATEAEEMVAEYRRQAEERANKMQGIDAPDRKKARAIDRGLVKRVAGVLASEGLTFKMTCNESGDATSQAWTDFTNISITYGSFQDAHGDPDFRMIAANFRGLAYHEGGHIRWTIPFRDLVTLATGEEKSNRWDNLHKSWNLLEDQRMETAVVSDSPAKAKYFLPMVMEHNCPTNDMLAMNYPYIVWRKYMPAKVRRQGRRLFLRQHPQMTEALCDEMEAIIETYVLADDPLVMFKAIQDFDRLYQAYVRSPLNEDSSHLITVILPGGSDDAGDRLQVPIDPNMFEDVEGDDPMPGKGGSGKDDSKDAGEGEGEGDSKGKGGQGAGSTSPDEMKPGTEDDLTDRDLQKLIQDAEDVRNNDRTLDADEMAMQEAAQEFGSTLPIYSTGVNTNPEMQAIADNLAYEVENAFHAATMDKAPAWVEQQNRGVINVIRYETRQSGQTDFYRQWTDDDQPGLNIAVSVLLDNSGSMAGKTEELAAAGFASKLACARLDIPCTVTLWNTNAQLLWDHHDKADFIPLIAAEGGTNPREALADIFAQRMEKPMHVVLIMTDGSWSGGTADLFNAYRTPGTHFVVVSYDSDINTANKRAEAVAGYGADTSVGIDNLMQIPKVLEQALADAVSMVP